MKHIDQNLILSLFPDKVKVKGCDPETVTGTLYPDEHLLIEKAISRRKKDFMAGRICARELLKEFNIDDFPILMGKKREPLWPSGICGSISHAKKHCFVAIALKKDYQSVGIDIEQVGRLDEKGLNTICTDKEIHYSETLPQEQIASFLSLIFSIKECFYKAQYPLTQRWLGFKDVEATLAPKENTFTIHIIDNTELLFNEQLPLKGKYIITPEMVACAMVIPHL